MGPRFSRAQDGLFDEPLEDAAAGEATPGAPATDPQAQFEKAMADANAQMQQQNWSAAIDLFNQALALGRDPRALLGQGICFKNLGSQELALNAIAQALLTPGSGRIPGFMEQAYLERGALYLEGNRYREAVDDFSNAKQNNPSNAMANMQHGKALLRLVVSSPGGGLDQTGQASLLQAAKSLEQAVVLQPDLGEAYLERGRVLFRLRQIDFAITDLQQAVQKMGANSDASAELGIALVTRANQAGYEPTPDDAQILTDLRSGIAAMDAYLGGALLGQKRLPWATQDALKQQPEKVLISKGEALLSLAAEVPVAERPALYQQVVADADRLLATDLAEDDMARAHYLRGLGLRMLDDLPNAIQAFSRAIQVYQSVGATYTEAHLRRGICYFYQDKVDAALQDFQAAAPNPTNPYAYEPRAMFWIGMVQAHQGDFDSAIRSYTRAVGTSPRYVMAYLNRGLAYLNVGRYDQAAEDFNVVLRQEPNNRDAIRYLEMATTR